MKKICITIIIFNLCVLAFPQSFVNTPHDLPNDIIPTHPLTWADMDNDGDYDALFQGQRVLDYTLGTVEEVPLELWENKDSMQFNTITPTTSDTGFFQVGDMDNDNDLDIVFSGCMLLNNGKNSFKVQQHNQQFAKFAIADMNNDGLLDIVDVKDAEDPVYTRLYNLTVYENNGKYSFESVWEWQQNLYDRPPLIGDMDADGDLDIVAITKNLDQPDYEVSNTYIIENNLDSTEFEPIKTGIPVLSFNNGSIFINSNIETFGLADFNYDGIFDLHYSGHFEILGNHNLFYNAILGYGDIITILGDHQGFKNAKNALYNDFDADGDVDYMLLGMIRDAQSNMLRAAHFYENNSGTFMQNNSFFNIYDQVGTKITGMPGMTDVDGDHDMDIMYAIPVKDNKYKTFLYENTASSNTRPLPPTNVQVSASTCDTASFTISWNAGSDAETPTSGLKYNLRIGTSSGETDIKSPMALPNGSLLHPNMPFLHSTSYELRTVNITDTFYISVQTIDGSGTASSFSSEVLFVVERAPFIHEPMNATSLSEQVVWGDYDGDEDYDIFSIGKTTRFTFGTTDSQTSLQINNGSSFTEIEADIPGLTNSHIEWGDMEADGDLDILIVGETQDNEQIAAVYKNNDGVFERINLNFFADEWHHVSWFDIDNDGDLDIFSAGNQLPWLSDSKLKIYRYASGWYQDEPFYEFSVNEFSQPRFTIFDAGNDGYPEIFIYGDHYLQDSSSVLLSGHADGFSEIQTSLPPLNSDALIKPVDIQNNGLNDLLILTKASGSNVQRIYLNEGSGQYQNSIDIGPFEGQIKTAEVADFDNDGFPEIFLGFQKEGLMEYHYLDNEQGNLNLLCHTFPTNHLIESSSDIGDPDHDGDVDILISAITDKEGAYQAYMLENQSSSSNNPPQAPVNLYSSAACDSIVLSWSEGLDVETPVEQLQYRVQIADAAGTLVYNEELSAEKHLLQHEKNRLNGRTRNITKNIGTGSFIWTVFTVDRNGMSSQPAQNDTFTITELGPSVFNEIKLSGIVQRIAYKGTGLYPADFDLDGDMDLLVSGSTSNNPDAPAGSILYENNDGSFDSLTTLPPFYHPHLSPWLDVNYDGYPDLLIINTTITNLDERVPDVFLNSTGDAFTKESGFFDWLVNGYFINYWGHINSDGYIDYKAIDYDLTQSLWIGENSEGETKTCDYPLRTIEPLIAANLDAKPGLDYIYKNLNTPEIKAYVDGQPYTLVEIDDQNATPKVDIADYDSDGDMDVLLSNIRLTSMPTAVLLKQEKDGFHQVKLFHNRAWQGFAIFADYDGDHDVDIILNGENKSGKSISEIYENIGGTFKLNSCTSGLSRTTAVQFDADADGDLDLVQIGYGLNQGKVEANTTFYDNTLNYNYQPPAPPESLTASYQHCNKSVEIQWNPPTNVPDSIVKTYIYQINVGTHPGKPDFFSSYQHPGKSIPGKAESWLVNNLAPGETYYISVRAKNTIGIVSENNPEISFEVPYQKMFKQQHATVPGWSETYEFLDISGDSIFDGLAYFRNEVVSVAFEHPSFRIKNDFFPLPESYDQMFDFYSDTLVSPNTYSHTTRQIVDYNNDGWLDVLIQVRHNDSDVDKLYINQKNGYFLETNLDSMFNTETSSLSMRLGDMDNDGDLDIVNGREVYQLTEDGITRMANLPLEKNLNQIIAFFDYNNDGWLDLLIHKPFVEALFNEDIGISIYENQGDFVFTEAVVLEDGVFQVQDVSVADMNNDGYADVVLAARERNTDRLNFLAVYTDLQDKSAHYLEIESGGYNEYQIDAGDIDLDGFTDIAVVGGNEIHYCWGLTTRFFRNMSDVGYSNEWCAPIPSNAENVQILDTDFDGRMEIVTSKAKDEALFSDQFENIEIYEYLENNPNQPPQIPTGLQSWYDGASGRVILSWKPGLYNESPSEAISYALNLGTEPGKYNLKHVAAQSSGLRRIAGQGNIFQSNKYEIKIDEGDTLYWNIQAIDQAHTGSAFSKEQMIIANAGKGYIQGVLEVSNRDGITIYLVDAIDGDTLRSGTTDNSGKYRFGYLPDGSYQLVVSHPATGMSDNNPFLVLNGVDSLQANIYLQDGLFVYDITEPVYINQPESTPEISLYPNPATDQVIISIAKHREKTSGQLYVMVYDALGREVYFGKTAKNRFNLDVKQWNRGVYIVMLTTDEWQGFKKLIIK